MSRILISLLVGYVPFLSEAARPKAITFDCAQTLLEVDLNPAGVVIQSAEELGCKIEDKERAAQVFQELFDSDKEIQESLNGAFNAKVAQARMRLWVNFAQRWAEKVGVPKGPIPLILAKAYRKIRDPGFERLKLYPETLSTLKKLKEQGYKLAVISNWGMNLKDVLDHFKLTPYFDVIIGSEEVRVEKPNPKIFQINYSLRR
jgi:FMN phosphatase YigB (HAD superfamily)